MSLDDERTGKLADILGNKSCKKILDFLSEMKEASETDISQEIKMPINTVGYNVKKLLGVGLIEKSKNYFWSAKGKKIKMYRVSGKSILISPKSRTTQAIKSVLPAAIVSGLFALLIRVYYSTKSSVFKAADQAVATAGDVMTTKPIDGVMPTTTQYLISSMPAWAWFLSGALFALIIYVILYTILNWRKVR